MLLTMSISLAMMFAGNVPLRGIGYTAVFMLVVACWAWRFPGSVEEHERRLAAGEKVGWLK